jgi:hypothetical protein
VPELIVLRHLVLLLRSRWDELRAESEAGYTTETVVVTALLVVLAVAVITIIAVKVTSTANNISTGGN